MQLYQHWVRLAFCFVCAGNAVMAIHAQDTDRLPADDEKALQCGILGAAISNAHGIQTGDVLTMTRRFYDGPQCVGRAEEREGTVLSEAVFKRIMFDIERQRFLILSRTISEWTELDKVTETADVRTVRTLDSRRIEDLTGSKFYWQSGSNSLSTVTGDLCFGLTSFEDPRSIGIWRTGFSLPDVEEFLSHYMNGSMLIDAVNTDEEVRLRFGVDKTGSDDTRQVIEMHLHAHSSLPARMLSYTESRNGGRSSEDKASFQWDTTGSLALPVSTESSYVSQFFNPDRSPNVGLLSQQVDVHWFSVNEPVPENMLDKDILLMDTGKFEELVDPEKSGAVTLLKALKAKE